MLVAPLSLKTFLQYQMCNWRHRGLGHLNVTNKQTREKKEKTNNFLKVQIIKVKILVSSRN